MFTAMTPINSPAAKPWEACGDETLASTFQNQSGVGHLTTSVVCEGATMVLQPGYAGASASGGCPVYPKPSTSSFQIPTTPRCCCLSSVCHPSLPACGIPKGSDIVLFVYGSLAPGIAPGAQGTLGKYLLKEE